jgi:hypothetical protein
MFTEISFCLQTFLLKSHCLFYKCACVCVLLMLPWLELWCPKLVSRLNDSRRDVFRQNDEQTAFLNITPQSYNFNLDQWPVYIYSTGHGVANYKKFSYLTSLE